jgi:hypothetical protein
VQLLWKLCACIRSVTDRMLGLLACDDGVSTAVCVADVSTRDDLCCTQTHCVLCIADRAANESARKPRVHGGGDV